MTLTPTVPGSIAVASADNSSCVRSDPPCLAYLLTFINNGAGQSIHYTKSATFPGMFVLGASTSDPPAINYAFTKISRWSRFVDFHCPFTISAGSVPFRPAATYNSIGGQQLTFWDCSQSFVQPLQNVLHYIHFTDGTSREGIPLYTYIANATVHLEYDVTKTVQTGKRFWGSDTAGMLTPNFQYDYTGPVVTTTEHIALAFSIVPSTRNCLSFFAGIDAAAIPTGGSGVDFNYRLDDAFFTIQNYDNHAHNVIVGDRRFDGMAAYIIWNLSSEIQTISNVNCYVTYEYTLGFCDDGSIGPGPGDCKNDCPDCGGGVAVVPSGGCASVCASSGTSATLINGWTITGPISASSISPGGWTVRQTGQCQFQVCAPCLPKSLLDAGTYAGPYSLVLGLATTCIDSMGHTVYKTLTATFTLSSVVICPDATTPNGRAVSYDVSDARRHARAYIANLTPGTAGAVKVGLGSNVLPIIWNDSDAGLTANDICLRFDRQSIGSPLLLLTEVSGAVSLLKSVNEGRSFMSVASIGTGKHPALLIARDGRRLCYYVSGTSIKGKILDASGAVQNDTFTAISAGVDDDSISADEFTVSQSRWGVGLLYRSGGQVTYRTSVDGIVFA